MAEATNTKAPALGQLTKDGVYAGLTDDGKQQIFAMPEDLKTRFLKRPTMTFNKAAKRVAQLNAHKALHHDDWQIPSLEILRILKKNRNEGKLKGTFNTVISIDASDWYWSSTKEPDAPYIMRANASFANGEEDYVIQDDYQLSCRPVRLVPVAH